MRVFLFCTEKGIRIPLGRRDDCLKIHLVYDSHFEPLEQTLKEIGHTVIWDYSVEQFSIFAESGHTDADVALVDGTARGLRLQELYELLKEIRKNLYELRIIIQFPSVLIGNKSLIDKLIGLNIYDIHFADEFTIEDVENWMNHRMTLVDLRYDGQKLQGELQDEILYHTGKVEQPKLDLGNLKKFLPRKRNISKLDQDSQQHSSFKNASIISEKGTKMIGVMSAHRGAGSTFHSIHIAKNLSLTGKVALIEMVDYCDPTFSSFLSDEELSNGMEGGFNYDGIDFFLYQGDTTLFPRLLHGEYVYLVIDFGLLYKKEKNKIDVYVSPFFNEFLRTNDSVIVSGSQPWNIEQLLIIMNDIEKLKVNNKKWNILLNLVEEEGDTYKEIMSMFTKEIKKNFLFQPCKFISNPFKVSKNDFVNYYHFLLKYIYREEEHYI